jgi:hypothetical protein
MDFLKQNMMPIAAGVLLLGGIFVYMSYFAAPSAPAALTASDADASLSQNLLVTLQNLHTIKLDNSIFSDPAFQSLTDFGVVIPSQTPGRRNPFAPLGSTVTSSGLGSVNVALPKIGTGK